MSIMENKDLTGIVIPEVKKGYPIGEPHFRDIFGDTDGDAELPEEFYQNIPEIAAHWDEYNEKNWWDSRRFYHGKYEIVACTGTPEDYTYETVDATNKWKEARRLEKEGADVYVNGERIHFVDHEAVQKAFDIIKGLFLNRQSFMWDDDFLDIEDVIDIEEAHKILDQNGFKINEAWEEKIRTRSRCGCDPLTIPLMDRPRFMFKSVNIDDLPF